MSSSTSISDLKWIEDEPSSVLQGKPEFDEFELVGQRSFQDLILGKCRENILVPIGLVATTLCLSMGLVNMVKGNSAKQQMFMRGRVGFQFATLIAMTTGMYVNKKKRS